MDNMEAANILREELAGYSTHHADEVRAAYEKAIRMLECRDKTGWYPCDKMPPPKNVDVLVSIAGTDIISLKDGEDLPTALQRTWKEGLKNPRVEIGFISTEEGWEGWTGIDGWPMIVHPDAWRPLPEGWHGDEGEDEENG